MAAFRTDGYTIYTYILESFGEICVKKWKIKKMVQENGINVIISSKT